MNVCSVRSNRVHFKLGFCQKRVQTVVSVTVGSAVMLIHLIQVMIAAVVRALTKAAVMNTENHGALPSTCVSFKSLQVL